MTKNTLLKLTFSVFLFSFTVILYSQNFTGRITDKNNDPLYGSTVFIREIIQGLACNDSGYFQITLPVGKYTVDYRCLGYESLEEKINIEAVKSFVINKNIVLQEKTFELAEVTVSNKEDPAYEIIRKAIKKAPYYLNVVKEYEADTYIKGNMELTNVSGFINRMTKEEGMKLSDFKNKLMVQESYNTIKFTAPDKYEQTVQAFSSTIPDDYDPEDAMSIIQGSLYAPEFGGLISPLHPKAFSYYKFKYEGFSEDDGQVINKIKVIPKLKDFQLAEGYIYIADNTWDIRQAELISNVFGIKRDFIITYSDVSRNIYLPVTYTMKMYGSIMGIGGYFNYYASVKYLDLTIDETAAEKEIIKPEKKKSLELKADEYYSTKTDSLATKRDSVFWASIRNIPLNDLEIRSYERKDSMQLFVDSARNNFYNSSFELSDLISGGKIGGDSAKFTFRFDGLMKLFPEFNYVDGYYIGQKFELSTRWNTYNRLIFSPKVYYTTARKDLVWDADITFKYSPLRLGELKISGGDISADYNYVEGNNRLDNTFNIAFYGKNVSMLYRKKYVGISNDIDLANGLRLSAGFEAAKRSGLMNNTYRSLFGSKNKVKSNLYFPGNFDLAAYKIGLIYTPRYYYSIYKGVKRYYYAKSPTFFINYSEGFSSWLTNNSKYRKIRGGIMQTVKTDVFSHIYYSVNGGSFIGKKGNVHFADFQHFNAMDLFFVTKSPYNLFMLLNRYEASTNEYWAEAHIKYNSRYILLKRLPFLQGKMFNEEVSINYLYTPNKKNYIEAGYSIDLMNLMNLGVHCSFDKLKYEGVGVRLVFNTILLK